MSKPNNSKPQLWKVIKRGKTIKYRIIYPNNHCEWKYATDIYDDDWYSSCFIYDEQINNRRDLMNLMSNYDDRLYCEAVFVRNL